MLWWLDENTQKKEIRKALTLTAPQRINKIWKIDLKINLTFYLIWEVCSFMWEWNINHRKKVDACFARMSEWYWIFPSEIDWQ